MVGAELKDAFDKLTDEKGTHWHSVNELRVIIGKTESSIRAKLKGLLQRNHVKCRKATKAITYNTRGTITFNLRNTGQEITVNRKVVLWRLI